MITVFPELKAETTPEELTVATAVLVEDQPPPVFPLEEKVPWVPAQREAAPDKVPASGSGFTVRDLVAALVLQLLVTL